MRRRSTKRTRGGSPGVARGLASLLLGLALIASASPGMAELGGAQVRVNVDGRVRVVPLELYVGRSVEAETYASWPIEALRAQAVVARTYALHERRRHAREAWDVESTVVSQRYSERPVPQRIQLAVGATRGQYLAFGGQPILAAFHASAGGRTASAEEVWGQPLPYLRSVSSPDDDSPDFFWSFELPRGSIAELVGGVPRIVARSPSGRVLRLRAGEREWTGRELRRKLGGRALRSTRFEVRELDGRVRFVGSGSGHGVGMCQWGARSLAQSGQGYRQILEHYYPGSRLIDPGNSGNAE